MWGIAVGIAAVLGAAGVYDWRVRRRRGAVGRVDGQGARDGRIRDEGRGGMYTGQSGADSGSFG